MAGAAFAQTTHGDCSPILLRNSGSVTVQCGPADADINFLLAVLENECKDFKPKMDSWFADGVRNGNYYFPELPAFSARIIADLSDEKAVLYQYDPEYFVKIYGHAVRIPEFHEQSANSKYLGYNNVIHQEDKKFLYSVAVLCQWAGVNIQIEKWKPHFDMR